jgi:hypothetical protein
MAELHKKISACYSQRLSLRNDRVGKDQKQKAPLVAGLFVANT